MAYKDPIKQREFQRVRMQRLRRERRDRLREIKAAQGCKMCGEMDPIVLVFHHPDPTVKKINIGRVGWHGGAAYTEKLIEEALTCEVLCCNCHARVHFEELETIRQSY